jgi:hypothetical protein
MGYSPAQFRLTDDSIQKFRRWIKKPNDCVVNAMELLGVIDNTHADIIRIVIQDKPLEKSQIREIFSYVQPRHVWRMTPFKDINLLKTFTRDILQPGYASFMAYSGNPGHVFIIAKNLKGEVMYVDPQVNVICNLDDPRCYQYIANKESYFILEQMRR